MSWTYITGVGPPQEKHLVPAYAALVTSSIELRSDEGQTGGKGLIALLIGRQFRTHNPSARFVLLHAPMCLGDLVKMEDLADLHVECAGSDLLDQFLERCAHEVFRFACIRCKADRGG
jgi:hypothetical protein